MAIRMSGRQEKIKTLGFMVSLYTFVSIRVYSWFLIEIICVNLWLMLISWLILGFLVSL